MVKYAAILQNQTKKAAPLVKSMIGIIISEANPIAPVTKKKTPSVAINVPASNAKLNVKTVISNTGRAQIASWLSKKLARNGLCIAKFVTICCHCSRFCGGKIRLKYLL